MIKYYNLHSHTDTNSQQELVIVNQYPRQLNLKTPYYSVGIHPWYIAESKIDEELEIIDKTLSSSNCLALGECGLDKKTNILFHTQINVCKEQLLLAEKHKKAVILHVVSAYQEIISLKKELKLTVPLIVHGFNKKQKQVAESLWQNGFYLSFGKNLMNSDALGEVMKSVPVNNLFLETDNDANLSIEEVYTRADQFIPHIAQAVEQNFKRVFDK